MGLLILVLGLIVFFAGHIFVTFREARAAVIERLGLTVYRALFGLVSLVGVALIIWGFGQYKAHDWIQVWSPPAFMRHITVGHPAPSDRAASARVFTSIALRPASSAR